MSTIISMAARFFSHPVSSRNSTLVFHLAYPPSRLPRCLHFLTHSLLSQSMPSRLIPIVPLFSMIPYHFALFFSADVTTTTCPLVSIPIDLKSRRITSNRGDTEVTGRRRGQQGQDPGGRVITGQVSRDPLRFPEPQALHSVVYRQVLDDTPSSLSIQYTTVLLQATHPRSRN